jgi:hypothetical protein
MRWNSPAWSVPVLFALALALLLPAAPRAEKVLVRIQRKAPIQFEQLSRLGVEILAVTREGTIDVAADERQVQSILALGYPASVVPFSDIARTAAALDANLGLYHTYAELDSTIHAWETAYPAICKVYEIGTSIEARTIFAVKISDNVATDETDETEVLYFGNLHARELMSVEMPLLFAGYLLENYGSDPEITAHVDGKEIFFIPMSNPDGHVYVQQNHSGGSSSWWRKNRRVNANLTIGVDLNRNFGYEWGYDNEGSSPTPSSEVYRGTAGFSEPETQVIRDFVNGREFTMWLSYHSYGELLLYPWGYDALNTPHHKVFAALGDSLTAFNDYLAGNTASGAIYVTNGDSDDWGYGEQTSKDLIFAFTAEVNTYSEGGFGPADTMIEPTFEKNLAMNMGILTYADNPYRVLGPTRPTMYAIADPYYPVHTVEWSSNVADDPNPAVSYNVERCLNPSFVTDQAEVASSDWSFDGFTLGTTRYSGTYAYYSGQGNGIYNTLTTDRPQLVTAATDTFTFWASYSIEDNWDYAYVDVSTDFGETWAPIPGNITTATNPNGTNRGYGITGSSATWVKAIFPLTAYVGDEILLRIAYVTDSAVSEHGIDVDVLAPVPTCASVTIVASAVTDTSLLVVPDVIGTYQYRVEARDAESQSSGWSGSASIEITTVSDSRSPLSFQSRLDRNYPNPFNPSTTIPYGVGGLALGGAPQRVTLRIYSVTGELIATIVDAELSPGTYEATWDGRRATGGAAASGVYFARLVVGSHEALTRKLVLLK